jgi:uncharacterized MAPEG superfamily protein
MALVAIITVGALIQYVLLSVRVGQARGKYGVEAPAITGHPMFERRFRVHQNTLEALIVFLPALWMCAYLFSAAVAAVLGILFIVARFVYERGYVEDPQKRGTGAIMTAVALSLLLVSALIGAVIHLF